MEDTEGFASRVDHTLLGKDHTVTDVEEAVREASEYGTNVCLPPSRVEDAERLADALDFDGELVTVVGFPHGTSPSEVKAFEAERVVENGATEVDVACNVSFLKSGEHDDFRDDIGEVIRSVGSRVTVKAIIETGLLTREEKERAAELCADAGADYVKTCTGFSEGEGTVEDVQLLDEALDGRAEIKASGGIGSYDEAVSLLEAGASRIGASSGTEIVEEYLETTGR
ncbi:MAG: deoxyribose-phosphate aldolase, partial [Halobacteria archaeon]|nr:deoxyribose-phosphate aldolase [Halobacteria archaeon]